MIDPRGIAKNLLDPDMRHGPADRGLAGTVLNLALDNIERLRAENERLREALDAARAYRAAQQHCDETGFWRLAQEAAVVLDAALADLDGEVEND